jgi:hypothetical protein
LIGYEEVAKGGPGFVSVHPVSFFRPAICGGASAIIAVHNHPSGDPEPSRDDVEMTRRLEEGAKALGIRLLDHVVVGESTFRSAMEPSRPAGAIPAMPAIAAVLTSVAIVLIGVHAARTGRGSIPARPEV